jgi:8-oxo-dGTP pyrophosphatase MutT (NUDIX family)
MPPVRRADQWKGRGAPVRAAGQGRGLGGVKRLSAEGGPVEGVWGSREVSPATLAGMQPCGLDVAATTAGQPFCAGVILMVEGRLVLTLNRDHLPTELESSALRVGGVGGGQEAGETIWECAAREAREEIGCDVKLVSAPRTYLRENGGALRRARGRDEIAPLLFEWSPNKTPDRPYAPGLPKGPLLYGAMFLARPVGTIRPGDVEGLLLISPAIWSLIVEQATLGELVEAGATVVEREPLARELRLWSFPEESMRTICELAARDPELLSPLQ